MSSCSDITFIACFSLVTRIYYLVVAASSKQMEQFYVWVYAYWRIQDFTQYWQESWLQNRVMGMSASNRQPVVHAVSAPVAQQEFLGMAFPLTPPAHSS